MDELDEIIEDFLVESTEALDQLDEEFVELEKSPRSQELLGSIFRTVHTIKGTASFLDFHRLEKVAHAGENVLSLLRDGELLLDAPMTSTLLEMVDAVRDTVEVIRGSGSDDGIDYTDLIASLVAIAEGAGAEDSDEAAAVPAKKAVKKTAKKAKKAVKKTTKKATKKATDVEASEGSDPAPEEAVETAPQGGSTPPAAAGPETGTNRPTTESSIRVDVDLLDHLMNLVSELVLARNQIRQYRMTDVEPAYENATQQLDLLTSDLQQAVMATRMQPVSNIFSRLPRMVRDVAATCGKKVQLDISGGDTELDKTLLEAIRDPLTHIVRNAVDHGLESPEERAAAGKDETGRVHIHAQHEGGQVMVTLSDDGKGFDLERIAAKAIDKGLATADQVEMMSDRELANLAFHPGLSTAEAVTTVSGRGVGMDVVVQRVGEIGGAIDIDTTPGLGTTVTLRIPLTLAIIPALRVSCGGRRYLIPQINVVELHQVEQTGIETVGNATVFRLRGELLPLVNWRTILEPGSERDSEPTKADDSSFICVLNAHGLDFGLVVDKVESTEEIVVKPLPAHVKEVRAFAGSAVLGDGSIALILDPLGVTMTTGLSIDSEASQQRDQISTIGSAGEVEKVLVCDIGTRRVAFELHEVSRLENFGPDDIELAAGRTVVQYRGSLMPIVDPYLLFGEPDDAERDECSVLVLRASDGAGSIGVVVDRIREVHEVDTSCDAAQPGPSPVRLSVPIDGVVTDVISATDVRDLVATTLTITEGAA